MEWKWMETDEISKDMETNPAAYTSWFHLIFKEAAKKAIEYK